MTNKEPVKPTKRPFAKSILVGVVILAFVAIIFAWLDETGAGDEFIRVISGAKQ